MNLKSIFNSSISGTKLQNSRWTAIGAALGASCLMAMAVTSALTTLAWSPKAEACRDCPFPMKTGENHWIMPNGQIEVVIHQYARPKGMIETRIELHSVATGRLLASGMVMTPKGQTNVQTQLLDSSGNQVEFEAIWYDENHDRVQIGMHCISGSCSIDSLMN